MKGLGLLLMLFLILYAPGVLFVLLGKLLGKFIKPTSRPLTASVAIQLGCSLWFLLRIIPYFQNGDLFGAGLGLVQECFLWALLIWLVKRPNYFPVVLISFFQLFYLWIFCIDEIASSGTVIDFKNTKINIPILWGETVRFAYHFAGVLFMWVGVYEIQKSKRMLQREAETKK